MAQCALILGGSKDSDHLAAEVANAVSLYRPSFDGWATTPHLVSPPGAETLAQVRERVLAGLQRLRAGHQNEVVCLVAHGIPVRILILEALGLGLDRIWSLHSAPTGISELEFRDDWTALHRMNTLVHLDVVPADR